MGKKKKLTIGLGFLFDYLYENYSTGIFTQVQHACQESNLNFIVLEAGNSRIPTFGLYHRQKNLVIRLLDKCNIDGMILIGEQVNNTFTDVEIAELLKKLEGIPIVSIGMFDKAVANFAMTYADQTERDYQLLVGAVDAGRIVAAKGI